MAAEKPFPLNLKLDREKDKDIINFLADKPNAYIVRLALRRFMNDASSVLSETPESKGKASSEEESDLLNF